MERWREQLYLEHSAKGTTWGKHKYIAIKNGRYIYPSDLKKKIGQGLHNLKAKYEEMRYLKPNYTSDMGYNRSRQNTPGTEEKGYMGNPTGNAGANNIRKGVEAGRKRAGIKASGNVNGLSNNLRDKGYPSAGRSNLAGGHTNWNYSEYTGRMAEADYYHDYHKAQGSRLKEGTAAGRKRIEADKRRKQAEATQKRISKGINAGRKRAEAEREKKYKEDIKKKTQRTYKKIQKGLDAARKRRYNETPYSTKNQNDLVKDRKDARLRREYKAKTKNTRIRNRYKAKTTK